MTNEQIRQYGLKFRKAIESLTTSEFPQSSFFENFPRGCCGDTSNLFAKYLSKKGIDALYVWGINQNDYSHAWLEYRGVIIDLTADQFPEIHDKVIVSKESDWYKQFTMQGRYKSDFEEFNQYNSQRLGQVYKNIMNRLESSE